MLRIVLWLLILALCFLAGIVLSAPNLQPVTLNFYLGSLNLPLAALLVGALASGAFLGIVFNLVWLMRVRYDNRQLRKQNRQLEQELAHLRIP